MRFTLNVLKLELRLITTLRISPGLFEFKYPVKSENFLISTLSIFVITSPSFSKRSDFEPGDLIIDSKSIPIDSNFADEISFFLSMENVIALNKLKSQLIDISYPLFIVTVTFLTGLYFRFIEENKLALENLQKEAKLLKERELAAGVQKSLFPDISKFENFIFARNVPARDVSGDYFDVVRSTPEEYFFTLADVSGKGIKAGMYMAKASSIFRTLTNLKYPIEKVVFGVNNELVEAKFKGMFVTAVFGKLNIKTGELVFINAGHESILTFDKNKNYEYIKSDMPPIGIVKYFTESMVKSNTINLKDKTFVAHTDGVTEGYLKNGEELGAEGVQNIINSIENINPKNIVLGIEKELNWGAEKLRDDITCMAINIENTELIKKTK